MAVDGRLAEEAKPAFIHDVLDKYSAVVGDKRRFRFYRMDIGLAQA